MATTYDKASLVMIPSGYKDDKLYSVKPTDGSGDFTFSRDGSGASPATRVNASGLIEKGRENGVTYSNDFGNAAWTKSGVTLTGGQSGYDGSNDAWLLSGSNTSFCNIQNNNGIGSGVITFSVYAKAGNTNYIALQPYGSGAAYVKFDLSTGSVFAVPTTPISYGIESVGGGWYRCYVVDSFVASFCTLYLLDSSGNFSNTSSDSIYIQDAQTEKGLVATDYIETTTAPVSAGLLGDMPRLDYSGGATCPSLLLEPSRVNLLLHSEYFGYWSVSNLTATANSIDSPEGNQNAYLITSTGSGNHPIYRGTSCANGTYTMSVFLKKGAVTAYSSWEDGYSTTGIQVDLDNESVTPKNANTLNPFIETYADGWYRVGYSLSNTSGIVQPALYLQDANGNTNHTANGETIYMYGASLELGSYKSSYIPTYGSASGRAGDYCEKSGITSLIGQTEGTFFIECEAPNVAPNPNGSLLSTANSVTNSVSVIYKSNNTFLYSIFHSGNQNTIISSSTYSVGDRVKIAMTYSASEMKLFINGQSQGTNTNSISFNAALSQLVVLDMLSIYFGYPAANTTNQVLVFKSVLTDAECIALTTI